MALPLTNDQPDRSVEVHARTVASKFMLDRLGSLFAFLPLAVWTANHLWQNLAAFDSPEHWEQSVTGHSSNASAYLTSAVVLLPLLWHTVWGFLRLSRSRPAVADTRFSNLRYMLQRLSALGLVLFLGAHLWLAWFHPRFVEGRPEPFADIAHEMHHHLPTLAVYLLGVLGIAYHLGNGIWSFATMGWGFVVSKSAQAWLVRISIAAFLVLLGIGWAAVYGLYVAGA